MEKGREVVPTVKIETGVEVVSIGTDKGRESGIDQKRYGTLTTSWRWVFRGRS